MHALYTAACIVGQNLGGDLVFFADEVAPQQRVDLSLVFSMNYVILLSNCNVPILFYQSHEQHDHLHTDKCT